MRYLLLCLPLLGCSVSIGTAPSSEPPLPLVGAETNQAVIDAWLISTLTQPQPKVVYVRRQ